MDKMASGERASREVAEHFYKKYGCVRATEIISARLSGDAQTNRTEFWRDVLLQLAHLDQPSGQFDSLSSDERVVSYPSIK